MNSKALFDITENKGLLTPNENVTNALISFLGNCKDTGKNRSRIANDGQTDRISDRRLDQRSLLGRHACCTPS